MLFSEFLSVKLARFHSENEEVLDRLGEKPNYGEESIRDCGAYFETEGRAEWKNARLRQRSEWTLDARGIQKLSRG